MTKQINIPKGYKDSPLGVIPEEWKVKRLGEMCLINGDYGINARAVDFSEDLPTYLRITDIDERGKFISSGKKSVDHSNYDQFLLKNGDIVFARTGATVGKTYMYDEKDGKLVFAGFLIRYRPNTDILLPYYLQSYTLTPIYLNWVKKVSMRSGQPGINAKEYSSLKIPLPPLPEQQKIAEILSTWDIAIEKQNELIEQLELRKLGLMQQLLTGKKRIKGFNGEWKEVKLGEIANIYQPQTISQDKLTKEGYTVYGANGIIGKYHTYNHEKSQITVVCRGSTCGLINLTEPLSWITGNAMVINIDNNKSICKKFLHYYLVVDDLSYLISGSGQPQITSEIKFHKVSIPSLTEQTALAKVLSNADKEIEIEKQKLAALKNQKKGLMQVLLSGRVRVKI